MILSHRIGFRACSGVVEFGEFYTGAGTGAPAMTFMNEWAAGFNWPKGVPLPPMGYERKNLCCIRAKFAGRSLGKLITVFTYDFQQELSFDRDHCRPAI